MCFKGTRNRDRSDASHRDKSLPEESDRRRTVSTRPSNSSSLSEGPEVLRPRRLSIRCHHQDSLLANPSFVRGPNR